jgi:hypothetical protein
MSTSDALKYAMELIEWFIQLCDKHKVEYDRPSVAKALDQLRTTLRNIN